MKRLYNDNVRRIWGPTTPAKEKVVQSLQVPEASMTFKIEIEQESDERWIAEVLELPGVMAYGVTADEAKAKVQALALRVVAERLEHGEAGPDLLSISFAAA